MTKKEVLKAFKEYVLPQVQRQYETDGKLDKPARAEAWNEYTDALCKEGKITLRQYESWSNPF